MVHSQIIYAQSVFFRVSVFSGERVREREGDTDPGD